MKALPSVVLALASLLVLPAAHADIVAGINKIRARGCEGKRGVATPLNKSAGLDEVARAWSRGGRLTEAIARTDYRIVNSASMRVEGTNDERTILDVLKQGYCKNIVDASFTEIGLYQRGERVWVVVATPQALPTPADADTVAARVLTLVNRARATPRKCGSTSMPAVLPLKPSAQLDAAALAHAKDMTSHDFFEHRGSDGSTVADRVTRAGYLWQTVGENISAGAASAQGVVQGWLDSPGHCSNLMRAEFREMGIGYDTNPKTRAGIYWSQVFASPLEKVEPSPEEKKPPKRRSVGGLTRD
jgi:uncharacterized protein YkwD